MLFNVINYLDEKLSEIPYLVNPKGLAELYEIDGDEIPATFCLGEWTGINIEGGFTYHRQVGEIAIEEMEEEQQVSCEPFQSVTYPMRLVFCKLKSELNNSSFDPERVGNEISRKIHTLNNKALCLEIMADTVQVRPTGINTNTTEVYDEEYGLDTVPTEYVLIYINYEIIITGAVSCFEGLCP